MSETFNSPFVRVDYETGKPYDTAEEAKLYAQAAGVPAPQPVVTKPANDNPNKEYLICFKFDDVTISGRPTVTEVDINRFVEAQSRSEAYEKIKRILMDFDYEDLGYTRLDDSFVLVEDVTLAQKVSLFRFLELCLQKHGRNTPSDDFVAKILKEFLDDDCVDDYDYATEEEDTSVNCMPQTPATMFYGAITGEDIN